MAGWRFLHCPAWRRPLAVFVGGLIVLLFLTFLFLPLWLRGVLVVALFAGLLRHDQPPAHHRQRAILETNVVLP